MNKSEAYRKAIVAVMKACKADDAVEIMSILVPDYNTAKWIEEREKEVQA